MRRSSHERVELSKTELDRSIPAKGSRCAESRRKGRSRNSSLLRSRERLLVLVGPEFCSRRVAGGILILRPEGRGGFCFAGNRGREERSRDWARDRIQDATRVQGESQLNSVFGSVPHPE